MFSRSTAPAHCASDNNSIGKHVKCWPINSSACEGLNTVGSALRFVGVLGLIDLHLLIEPVSNTLQLADGGVVLLDFDALDVVHRLHLLRRRFLDGLGFF